MRFRRVDAVPDRAVIRRQLDIAENAPVVLFVAHNFKLKGLAELVRALSLPQLGGGLLLVVGRDRPGHYERLARRLGIGARVRFLGPVGDMVSLYHAGRRAGASDLVRPVQPRGARSALLRPAGGDDAIQWGGGSDRGGTLRARWSTRRATSIGSARRSTSACGRTRAGSAGARRRNRVSASRWLDTRANSRRSTRPRSRRAEPQLNPSGTRARYTAPLWETPGPRPRNPRSSA